MSSDAGPAQRQGATQGTSVICLPLALRAPRLPRMACRFLSATVSAPRWSHVSEPGCLRGGRGLQPLQEPPLLSPKGQTNGATRFKAGGCVFLAGHCVLALA